MPTDEEKLEAQRAYAIAQKKLDDFTDGVFPPGTGPIVPGEQIPINTMNDDQRAEFQKLYEAMREAHAAYLATHG